MRAILLVLILIVVAALIALGTGYVSIDQIRGAKAPEVSASRNGVTAKGGQTPAFDVQTGSVEVGTRNATVTVPVVRVKPPAGAQPANTTNAQ